MRPAQTTPPRTSDEIFEMACQILRCTRDGETLSVIDLALVQNACNGLLTPAGELMFRELYKELCA